MLEVNTERLEAFDMLLQKTPKFYFVELKAETFYTKEYAIKVLKDNTEEIQTLGKQVNSLLQENNHSLDVINMEKFNSLSDKMSALTEEQEEKGKVIAKQYKNYLVVEFYAEDAIVKDFNVNNDEYMDNVLNFLKDEYKNYLLK
ncbi:hypothetical protein [Planococcus sp. S3-L1]|uniref:hypothetical protein n=1 Tax=Planococcus sp. S3-L1 TaxID=3046200 RepID=UPI0024BBDF4F|nr:hypothetical protein [Planococcus sp. S3-L1]MDJ0332123.1 hypothetical protein [Planococcus sp. S3-L1]